QIDAQRNPDEIWNGMNFKVRQHIRRAEARYSVSPLDDPDRFAHFYVQNLKKAKLRNRTNFRQFSLLFSECQTRQCGQILGAWDLSGEPAAMTFLVWGYGVLYYLLSTRAPDLND